MSHVLSLASASSVNQIIDLRRANEVGSPQTGPIFKAVRLSMTAIKTGGSAATFVVAPLVVPDGGTVPTPSGLAIAGSPAGLILLDSTANPSAAVGAANVYTPGFQPQVYNEPVATHLMITCVAAGDLQIVID